MSKKANKASKVQHEELKCIPMRKVARVMTLIAGVLALAIVVFSAAEAAWPWAAVFAAVSGVAFYLAYAMTVDLREAH